MFQQTYRGDSEGRLVLTGRSPLDRVKTEIVASTLALDACLDSGTAEPYRACGEEIGAVGSDGDRRPHLSPGVF